MLVYAMSVTRNKFHVCYVKWHIDYNCKIQIKERILQSLENCKIGVNELYTLFLIFILYNI